MGRIWRRGGNSKNGEWANCVLLPQKRIYPSRSQFRCGKERFRYAGGHGAHHGRGTSAATAAANLQRHRWAVVLGEHEGCVLRLRQLTGWYSNPVGTAVAPLRPARAGCQTAWLPVPLRPSPPATANRSRLLPPVPDTRGPCPAPFRNSVRSGAAPTLTRTSTAGPL